MLQQKKYGIELKKPVVEESPVEIRIEPKTE